VIARFQWRGYLVSMGAPQPVIERVAELSGLEYGAGDAEEGWHIEADNHRLLLPGEHGDYPCETSGDLLVTAAMMVPALILWKADLPTVHAAAIVRDGQADLLLGPGSVGKTTLALEAWIAGWQVVGDDVVLVDPASGLIEAMPKPVKVRQRDAMLPARLLGRVSEADWAAGRILDEHVLILGRGLRGMAALGERYPVSRLLLLERSEDSQTRLRPADKYAAIAAIMAQRLATSKQGLELLTGLRGLVAERRVFHLQVGRGNPAGALDCLTLFRKP
jgi:hypothetical protein